ncbi:nucleoside/nucleotide kinase family protein [Marisediminicola senii]|uniref:uridine kinase n=1 Tax=Marisediminicola senii TaxID=2711233 RepID=UPI0013EC65AE|nr:uridine kinase [Marisediminicola senii]
MARWAPQKTDTLASIADEYLHNYRRGRTILAVDGAHGAGQAAFADDLADALKSSGAHTVRASLDDFQRPRADRVLRGADSSEGQYLDCYDYSALRRVLIEPFRLGEGASFVTAVFDADRDAPTPAKWITAPGDAVLVIDGVYLLRPELRGLWNYSIWLDTPEVDPSAGQRLYIAESSPRTTAIAIVDNADADHPRRVFADSC